MKGSWSVYRSWHLQILLNWLVFQRYNDPTISSRPAKELMVGGRSWTKHMQGVYKFGCVQVQRLASFIDSSYIRDLQEAGGFISIEWSQLHQEGNKVAHSFTAIGSISSSLFFVLDSLPKDIVTLILNYMKSNGRVCSKKKVRQW